ncbi:class II aldolase/adducin family protein [Magnetofaba australis]|uniref:Uncharacterized protein n=1 Tax=Magnetofaba australis IT-1 TaxID=1434232 RepID=A0A1Y2K4H5_9PROT|nr:class II aldolase/adducin family protein [Magnetofaba australis]OSM04265.1 hypothetical protein MAIT1_05294 [Magnetofaba australis IT-1]
MKNLWNETDAAQVVTEYGATYGESLALCVYGSRLLGADPQLVLHGGGNTSVKGKRDDLLGRSVQTLFVKGSGCDLATIAPAQMSPLELAPLRELIQLDALDDGAMADFLRSKLLDANAPAPPSRPCYTPSFRNRACSTATPMRFWR